MQSVKQIFCFDRRAGEACAQSFALWQQAAIETTRRDHSVIACSRHVYMDVILSSLPVCGESRIQHRTYYAAVTAVNEYHQQNWVDRSGN